MFVYDPLINSSFGVDKSSILGVDGNSVEACNKSNIAPGDHILPGSSNEKLNPTCHQSQRSLKKAKKIGGRIKTD